MQTDVATLALDDTLDVAEDIMTLGGVRHLPVVVGDRRLVGLVTQCDLLKASVASVLDRGRHVARHWLSAIPVCRVMAREILVASAEDRLRDAVHQMITNKIGCLPVVEGGKLVGLVTEADCLRALAHLLTPDRLHAVAH